MYSKINIATPLHNDPHPQLQWIESATSLQIPSFHIVGLPSREIEEARERVRAAIEASQLSFPRRRVVLNLSPASIRKHGTSLDLAMALAILAENLKKKKFKTSNQSLTIVACGELGLDGTVKKTGQITRNLYAAWEAEVPFLFLPQTELRQAQERLELIQKSNILNEKKCPQLVGVTNLREAWQLLEALIKQESVDQADNKKLDPDQTQTNVSDKSLHTKNSESIPESLFEQTVLTPLSPALERLLGVAAAGGHHFLLLGPKGSGKSQLLETFIAIVPKPNAETYVKQILLYELNFPFISNGLTSKTENIVFPKIIRRVGSQVRPSALIGGANATSLRPGEFSMAHGGVLIADELLEWHRDSREALREPLERGKITLTRSRVSTELPAQFTLAANGNFCPCGGIPFDSFPSTDRCKCLPHIRKQYLGKLSGPLLDRLDILFIVRNELRENLNPDFTKIFSLKKLKDKVIQTRANLIQSWGKLPSSMHPTELEALIQKFPSWQNEGRLEKASTLRSRHKIARLALTLACWDGTTHPTFPHFTEAFCLRPERTTLR